MQGRRGRNRGEKRRQVFPPAQELGRIREREVLRLREES